MTAAGRVDFVRRQPQRGVALLAPLDNALSATGCAATGDARADAAALLALDGFAQLSSNGRFVAALRQACASLGEHDPAAVSRALGM